VARAREAVQSVSLGGRGSIHQPLLGRRGAWLPLTWEAQLLPARAFVWRGRVRLLGVPLLRGSDEFRSGRGRFVMGRRTVEGDGVDRAEYTVLWAWTLLLVPEPTLARADVSVEQVGTGRARVLFPYGTETWECTLGLDPASGLLNRLDTHRVDIRTGHPRRWSVEVESYRPEAGRAVPAALLTRWEEDPALRLRIDEIHFD
jgi:hypothetical protein